VAAFLDGALGFDDIPSTIEAVVRETPAEKPESIEQVLEMDADARRRARHKLGEVGRGVGSSLSHTAGRHR